MLWEINLLPVWKHLLTVRKRLHILKTLNFKTALVISSPISSFPSLSLHFILAIFALLNQLIPLTRKILCILFIRIGYLPPRHTHLITLHLSGCLDGVLFAIWISSGPLTLYVLFLQTVHFLCPSYNWTESV